MAGVDFDWAEWHRTCALARSKMQQYDLALETIPRGEQHAPLIRLRQGDKTFFTMEEKTVATLSGVMRIPSCSDSTSTVTIEIRDSTYNLAAQQTIRVPKRTGDLEESKWDRKKPEANRVGWKQQFTLIYVRPDKQPEENMCVRVVYEHPDCSEDDLNKAATLLSGHLKIVPML